MGLLKVAAVVGVIAGVAYLCGFGQKPERPEIIKDGWYGRGKKKADDTSIKEFKVDVPEKILTDLKQRLKTARFGEDLEDNENFIYGVNVATMKNVLEHWKTKYDWRKHEKIINQFPQFKTQIEGIDVHFMRVKPKSKGPHRVLLMTHGWPGSVWEFYKILPLLTEPEKHGGRESDAFEVICPSIPGYGFSESPHQVGFSVTSAARVFVKLMERLGFNKFYLQGGDWGAIISIQLSVIYPERVQGLHLNMYPARLTPAGFIKQMLAGIFPSLFLKQNEIPLLTPPLDNFIRVLRESGYMHLQATKPDTIGMPLNDSPIGLAGYLLEKFSAWTRNEYRHLPDGGLTKHFTLDELLTNVMIYWVNGNIGPSQRFYREYFANEEPRKWNTFQVEVPAGLAMFPDELIVTAEYLARDRFTDIVQLTDMPQGGHFAAFEQPELLANDLKSFVRKLEQRKSKT